MSHDETIEEAATTMRYVLERALTRDLRVNRGEARNMVNRWLEQVKADAWEEGQIDGQINAHEHRAHRKMQNPYRQETDK